MIHHTYIAMIPFKNPCFAFVHSRFLTLYPPFLLPPPLSRGFASPIFCLPFLRPTFAFPASRLFVCFRSVLQFVPFGLRDI